MRQQLTAFCYYLVSLKSSLIWLQPATLSKSKYCNKFFPMNFAKLLRALFLQSTSGRHFFCSCRCVLVYNALFTVSCRCVLVYNPCLQCLVDVCLFTMPCLQCLVDVCLFTMPCLQCLAITYFLKFLGVSQNTRK